MSHLSPPSPAPGIHGADRRTLLHIFQHPLTHSLTWREVTGLFETIGSAEEQGSGEVVLRVGQARLKMRRPHGTDLTATEVMDLRHLLAGEGWSPGAADAPVVAAPETDGPDIVIVIDHDGARVYRLDPSDGDPSDGDAAAAPTETRHLLHHVDRARHDADRDETDPEDTRFFDGVATTAAGTGRILLIGHGKGQANEADHLSRYLRSHHAGVHARIVDEIVADLPHLTLRELLALGRHALAARGLHGREFSASAGRHVSV